MTSLVFDIDRVSACRVFAGMPPIDFCEPNHSAYSRLHVGLRQLEAHYGFDDVDLPKLVGARIRQMIDYQAEIAQP